MSGVETIAEKGTRLHADGKVTEHPQARVFDVDGDHRAYKVILGADQSAAWCTCPASGVCSHIAAVLLASGVLA